jgi:CheY-like chemotaxis protein
MNKAEDELRKTMYTSQLMRILMLDLLDLAQLENQTFKINFCDINLFEVVSQAFAIVQHYASLKRITF